MADEYPVREPMFSMKYVRRMVRTAAAMEVGPDGCWLLTVIVSQEDSCRYSRPVNFWRDQLCDLLGIDKKNENQLRRIRNRCVNAGWLHYEPGAKRKPGRYFVTIPKHAMVIPDGACDDGPTDGVPACVPECVPTSCQNRANIVPESCQNRAASMPIPYSLSLFPTTGEPQAAPQQTIKQGPSPGEGIFDPGQSIDTPLPSQPWQPLRGFAFLSTADPERTADLRAEWTLLIQEHGAQAVESACRRHRGATGAKAWPTDAAAEIQAEVLRAKLRGLKPTPPPVYSNLLAYADKKTSP